MTEDGNGKLDPAVAYLQNLHSEPNDEIVTYEGLMSQVKPAKPKNYAPKITRSTAWKEVLGRDWED